MPNLTLRPPLSSAAPAVMWVPRIITFAPPDGVSFFGPAISRIPSKERAVKLAVELGQPMAQTARDLRVHANT